MTLGQFILRNATRNRRRFGLTVGGVAVSIFLLVILQVMLRGMTDPATSGESAARVVVRHKVSLANMLFSKYRARLEQLPGVEQVSKLLWFGGIYVDEKNFFPQFACDADRLFAVMSEARIDPREKAQFLRERTACVVGAKSMERFGWKVGDRITLMGAMWPCNLELTIRGVYAGSFDDSPLYFHHEYFDELLGDKGFTGLFWVKTAHPDLVPGLIERIDAEFANSDAETMTETERSFQIGFVSMLGNIKMFIRYITGVIVFTLLLVTGGTMSMAVRERAREIAILKAVGFNRSAVFGLILSESFGMALLGGLAGCFLAWALFAIVNVSKLPGGLFVNFAVTPGIVTYCLMWAAALGVASCLLPAYGSLKLSVVDGMRSAD